MATETLELIVRTSGASAVVQQISSIGAQARTAAAGVNVLNDSLRFMRQTLVALSFVRAFEGITHSISEVQAVNNQLLQVTKTAADVPKAFNMWSQVALATHAPLESVVALGTTLARSGASAKMSSEQIREAIQSIFQTFRLSGSDPSTVRNVTKDLQEIFSLGTVQGRQFRAVILQDQVLAIDLAKYIHATGVGAAQVNKLLDDARAKGGAPNIRDMSMKFAGAFTGADFANAAVASFQDNEQKVKSLPTTLGQAFTDMHTQWLMFLNTIQQTGTFKPVVDFIEYLGHNIPLIATGVLALGAAWATWFVLGTVIPYLYGLASALVVATVNTSLWAARTVAAGILVTATFLLTIPEAMASLVATVAAGFAAMTAAELEFAAMTTADMAVAFAGFVVNASLAFATLGAEIVAMAPMIAAVAAVTAVLAAGVYALWTAVAGFLAPLAQLSGLFDGLHLSMKDLPSVFNGFVTTLTDEWPLVTKYMSALWEDMINGMKNSTSDLINSINPDRLLPGGIPEFERMKTNRPTNTAAAQLPALREALQRNIAAAQAANPQFVPPLAPGEPGGPQGKDPYAKAREALQQLENELSKFAGPASKFQDDIDKVSLKIGDMMKNTVNAKGQITAYGATWAQVSAVFAKVGFDDLTKSVDANGKAVYTSLKYEQAAAQEILGLKNTSREFAETQAMVNKALEIHAIDQAQANKLIEDAKFKRDSYNLSLQDTLAAGIQLAQLDFEHNKDKPREVAQAVTTQALKFDQTSDLAHYNEQMQVLQTLVANNIISNGAYVRSVQDIQKAFLATSTDGISGFQKGLLEVQQTMFDTSNDAAKVLTDSFKGLQDVLVQFAVTGKLNIHNMVLSIMTDLDTLIVKQAIMQPLVQMLSFGPGSNLGIGQPNGGMTGFFGNVLGGLFGGGTTAGADKQLGGNAANPMWVSIAPNVGDIFGGRNSGSSFPGDIENGGMFGTSSGNPFVDLMFGNAGIGSGSGLPSGGPTFASGGGGGLGVSGDMVYGGLFGPQGAGLGSMFQQGGFFSNLFNGGGGYGSFSNSILQTLGLGGVDAQTAADVGAYTSAQIGAATGTDFLSSLAAFATGGEFEVGGMGGTDSQMVAFRASPNETVSVRTPSQTKAAQKAQQSSTLAGGIHLHINGVTDADSFMRNKSQISAGLGHLVSRHMQRNGGS